MQWNWGWERHQNFRLVETLTAVENIILGEKKPHLARNILDEKEEEGN